MSDEIQAILLALNVAGWETGMVGGPKEVMYWARHRQTGQVLLSRGPASHPLDGARYLAQQCGVDVAEVGQSA